MLGSAQLDPTIEGRAFDGAFPLIYMSPEKLMGGGTLERLAAMHARKPLLLFAIDEAHCVSEWGHDFRPEYRMLGTLRQRMPDVPIMALTATAVPDVQADIVRSLGLRSPLVVDLVDCLKDILATHGSDVDAVLAADPHLARELKYDLKRAKKNTPLAATTVTAA